MICPDLQDSPYMTLIYTIYSNAKRQEYTSFGNKTYTHTHTHTHAQTNKHTHTHTHTHTYVHTYIHTHTLDYTINYYKFISHFIVTVIKWQHHATDNYVLEESLLPQSVRQTYDN